MKKKEAMKRWEDYSPEIQGYLEMLCDALIEKNGDIFPEYLISLDLLAMNFEIMLTAQETLRSMRKKGEDGFTQIDKMHGPKKSAAIQSFMSSQNHVNRILQNFGFTPLGKSRIKETKDNQDIAKYLAALTE